MHEDYAQSRILRDMNEGVMVLGSDGRILFMNPMAEEILEKTSEKLKGRRFASVFFEYEENDAFNQTILDAVYECEKPHSNVALFYTGAVTKYLNIITSGLRTEDRITGVIIVLSDITELVEVKERLKMMKQIEKLNRQLEERNVFIRKAFGKYLSDEIVEQVLDSPDGLEIGGRQEHITVMMSDLRGFTALCEQEDPETLMKMLNYYLDHMGKIIRAHHGTVIEYVGDGILAIFGAPTHFKNHAEEAVAAALEMQIAMKDINRWNKAHNYPTLKMGIGINTGDAVVGNMGSEYAMKYNVIGSSINLCGRIESYTVDGQIFIAPTVKEEIRSRLEIESKMDIHPKGVKETLTIYSITGIGAPYNIFNRETEEELQWQETKKFCRVFGMDGKHIDTEYEEGMIIGEQSGKLLLATVKELSPLQNILMKGEKDLYGKVLRKEEKGYLVSVTGGA